MIVIVDSRAEEDDIEKEIDKVKDLIAEGKGEVRDVEKWGRKRLAYEIRKARDGYYFKIRFTAPGAYLKELSRVLRMNEKILRHFTVKENPAETQAGS